MKMPKKRNMYCRKCKRHTEHAVAQSKKKERSSLKRGSIQRALKRGQGRGAGNLGKWGSKPPISRWKMAGVKSSKKTDFRFKCKECGKSSVQGSSFRSKKIEFV
ncbi:50S ribosomal protein L44e [Candidatus Woesearchaeota archaeon]|nr:50S ribosomal protein L44e [Candidatus Woesearchaeota archaeon]